MKRPLGLILTAIFLSLAALFLLLMTAVMVFVTFFWARGRPSAPQMPHFFIYAGIFVGVLYLGLAVWAILTVIGILRLRSWSRYSIIAIGAFTAFFSLMSILGLVVSRSAVQQRPGADPHIVQSVLLVIAVVEAAIAAVGVCWIVYFTRPRIRDLFRNALPTSVGYYPVAGPTLPATPYSVNPPAPPPLPRKPYTGLFSSPPNAPVAIRILGWLLLIGSVFSLIPALLPFPAFLLGFIIPPLPSHLIFAGFAVINAFIGYGLLKLKNSARLTAIALTSLGIVNAALSVLPQYQEHLRRYMIQYLARFNTMMPSLPGRPPVTIYYSSTMIVCNAFIGAAFSLFIIWALYHYRAAFTSAPEISS